MDTNNPNNNELRLSELVLASLEGTITEAQFQELQAIITANPQAASWYVDLILNHAIISQRKESLTPADTQYIQTSATDNQFWQELADFETKAPSMLVPVLPKELSPKNDSAITPVIHFRDRLSPFVLSTFWGTLAALLLLVAYIFLAPQPQREVAMVSKTVQAQWSDSDTKTPETNSRCFYSGKEYFLTRGIVSLNCFSGPDIILESPCCFEFSRQGEITIHSGKAYISVPKFAIGYTVYTPGGRIKDLGTEFGVEVDTAGNSICQVAIGKTEMAADGNSAIPSVIFTTSQAGKLLLGDGQIKTIDYDEHKHIRYVSPESGVIWRGESISLTSLLNGLDGFQLAQATTGIIPSSGQISNQLWEYGHYVEIPRYLPVNELSAVDGVFVPGRTANPAQVDSAGHRFDGFSKTTQFFYMYITASPYFFHLNENGDVVPYPLVLNGIDYALTDKPCIIMHANVGITFDLNKIRSMHPAMSITGFESVCGFSENCPLTTNNAEFFVLLDGKLAFHFNASNAKNRLSDITVAIEDSHRFLTLAVTDGRDEHGMDWCAFGSPELKLKVKK